MTKRGNWIAKIIEISESLPNVCSDLRIAYGYAEPGYDAPSSGIVVLANWNTAWFGEDRRSTKADNTMPRLAKVLEHFGAAIEWCDERTVCDCGKCVRTSPDHYGWKASYWYNGKAGEILCSECVYDDPSDYLEYLENNPSAALTLNIDLGEIDYVKYKIDCETGWHYSQNDDPKATAETLRSMGIEKFIFEIDEAQQFAVIWSIWIHKDELRRLKSYERKQRIAA